MDYCRRRFHSTRAYELYVLKIMGDTSDSSCQVRYVQRTRTIASSKHVSLGAKKVLWVGTVAFVQNIVLNLSMVSVISTILTVVSLNL